MAARPMDVRCMDLLRRFIGSERNSISPGPALFEEVNSDRSARFLESAVTDGRNPPENRRLPLIYPEQFSLAPVIGL